MTVKSVKVVKSSGISECRKGYLEFKEECLKQISRLGLNEWDIEIQHKVLEDESGANAAALTEMHEIGKVAMITLNKRFIPKDPRRVAKHEVAHILLGKIRAIAANRWMSEAEVDSEVEALCTRLEKVL